jgi:hypothetical protein
VKIPVWVLWVDVLPLLIGWDQLGCLSLIKLAKVTHTQPPSGSRAAAGPRRVPGQVWPARAGRARPAGRPGKWSRRDPGVWQRARASVASQGPRRRAGRARRFGHISAPGGPIVANQSSKSSPR